MGRSADVRDAQVIAWRARNVSETVLLTMLELASWGRSLLSPGGILMSRAVSIALFLMVFFVVAAVSPAQVTDQTSPKTPSTHHKSHSQKKAAPPPLVLPPLPPGPLQQVPMDKIPAIAPQVSYENGQLKIVADNATLGSILKDVHRLTGASIDLPPNGAPERVVTNIGPGAPRDVLALLLNGTQFNYVMMGSNSDPGAVSSVLLSPKPSSGDTQTVANAQGPQGSNPMMAPQPFRQQMLANQQQAAAQADDPPDDADNSDDKSNDADQNQQVQSAQDSNGNADQANQPNNGPKTPEQMLEMMRQRIPGMSQQPGQPGPLNPPNPSPPDQ
jgi:hypothetical protein